MYISNKLRSPSNNTSCLSLKKKRTCCVHYTTIVFIFLVGKQMATRYDCKFIETSVIINYNVDELLVGILTQIRLKLDQPPEHGVTRTSSMRKRSKSPLANLGNCGPTFKKYRGSRTSTSLRVKGLLSKVWARDSKSKSCENLHVL